MQPHEDPRPKVGLSACLSGQPVRYDGRDKYAPVCMEILARYVDFVPLCPEVAIGLGVPRPTIDLVKQEGTIRTRNRQNPDMDPTEALTAYADQVSEAFPDLCAYVFMSRSPSCAVASGRLYDGEGTIVSSSEPGLYAKRWRQRHPRLPVAEAESLTDPLYQALFLCRVTFAQIRQQWPSVRPSAAQRHLMRRICIENGPDTIDGVPDLLRKIEGSNDGNIVASLRELQADLIREPAAALAFPAFVGELLGTIVQPKGEGV